jgi:hypothetical protein
LKGSWRAELSLLAAHPRRRVKDSPERDHLESLLAARTRKIAEDLRTACMLDLLWIMDETTMKTVQLYERTIDAKGPRDVRLMTDANETPLLTLIRMINAAGVRVP